MRRELLLIAFTFTSWPKNRMQQKSPQKRNKVLGVKSLKGLWTFGVEKQILNWEQPSHGCFCITLGSLWSERTGEMTCAPSPSGKFKEAFQIWGKTIIILRCLPSYCTTDCAGLVLECIRRSGTRNSLLAVAIYLAGGSSEQLPEAHFYPGDYGLVTAIIKAHSGCSLKEVLNQHWRRKVERLLGVTKALSTPECLDWCVCGRFYKALLLMAEVSPLAQLSRCWFVMWEMYETVLWVLKDGDCGGGSSTLPHMLHSGRLDREIMACC